jgi:acetyltransferase, GNAT family
LEKDEYFLRAKRIEVPASITAVPFYKKWDIVAKME